MKIKLLLISILLFSLVTSSRAQYSLTQYFGLMKNIITCTFNEKDILSIQKLSNSTKEVKIFKAKSGFASRRFVGNFKTKEGANIYFDVVFGNYFQSSEKGSLGNFKISIDSTSSLTFNVEKILSFRRNFALQLIKDTLKHDSSNNLVYNFFFQSLSAKTLEVFKSIDSLSVQLFYDEYCDFFFFKATKESNEFANRVKWNMQSLYSGALISLLKQKNIDAVFKLIYLKNPGFSWILAEGLDYYNSIHHCLNEKQVKILERFNGKKELIRFRSKEELAKVYGDF